MAPADLNDLMERASVELAAMHYLPAEALCLQALAIARQQRDWAYYARILLPLQECRRQRRMIAAEGVVRLGTADWSGDLAEQWATRDAGCVVVTAPYTSADALALQQQVRRRQRHVEVLLADAGDPTWTLRSFAGPAVSATMAAPPAVWRERWLDPATPPIAARTPADWFIDASEALGDAALQQVQAPLGSEQRVDELEQRLAVVDDHELLHQALADAARALALRGH